MTTGVQPTSGNGQPYGGGRPRILVADDDPDILFLLEHVLGKAGYEVLRAADGAEALALAREQDPDLLVLDVSMPHADGYAVCRQIQDDGPGGPPVIFLTAQAHTAARVSGLDAGAVDYITKPFDAEELHARVRAALRTKTTRDALAVEAATDALTGLLNRSQLGPRVSELVSSSRRHRRPLACLMIDLDHFKAINDTYGHAAGDAVLVETARRFATVGRAEDVLIRYGGEEFLALLPETDAAGALAAADKLRGALAAGPVVVETETGARLPISVRASVGVACWDDAMGDAALLIAAADEALYRAKAAGRDRVQLAA